jgi:hypothetical protein
VILPRRDVDFFSPSHKYAEALGLFFRPSRWTTRAVLHDGVRVVVHRCGRHVDTRACYA